MSLSPRENEHPRLGLSIAKRQVPKAVHRNALKRVVREWFRQAADLNWDIGVRISKRVLEAKPADKNHWAVILKKCENRIHCHSQ